MKKYLLNLRKSIEETYTKNQFLGNILITIFGISILPLISIIRDYYNSFTIFTTLRESWIVVQPILFLNLKLWWVLAAFLAMIVMIFSIRYLPRKNKKVDTKPLPKYLNYTTAIFKKWRWSWKYQECLSSHCVGEITPYCIHCDTPLQYNTYLRRVFAYCPRCSVNYPQAETENIGDIEMIIKDNVKRDYNVELFDTTKYIKF